LRVPAINVDRGTFLMPAGLSYEAASFMEPLACVLRGQKQARIKPGQTVLVLGAGISGLMHIALARSLGAGLVIAADTIPFRLKKARELGAHLALEAGQYLVEELKAANQGLKADLVIIGFEGFIPLALECVERGGTALFFAGAAEGATIAKPINEIFWRTEVTLTSSYAGAPADCDQALRLIAGGAVPVEQMITHRLSLQEAQSGFAAVARPMDHDSLKVVILPHG